MASSTLSYKHTYKFEGDGWQAYDRALILAQSSRPDISGLGYLGDLHNCMFTAQVSRENTCRDCGRGLDHPITMCPWGVGVAQSVAGMPPSRPWVPAATVCMSWNNGACKFLPPMLPHSLGLSWTQHSWWLSYQQTSWHECSSWSQSGETERSAQSGNSCH